MLTTRRPAHPFSRALEEIMGSAIPGAGAPRPGFALRPTEEGFQLMLDVPGVPPENVNLSVEDGIMSIQAARADDRVIEGQESAYDVVLRLGPTIDPNGIEASVEHGVLTIRLPKAEAARPRKISVQGARQSEPQVRSGSDA